MSRKQIEIRTQDGLCRTAVFKPEGAGQWPALHGWTMADFPIYKEDAAERHFRELRMLFAQWLH